MLSIHVRPAGRDAVVVKVPSLETTSVLDFKFLLHRQMQDVHPDNMLLVHHNRRLEDFDELCGVTDFDEDDERVASADTRTPLFLSTYFTQLDVEQGNAIRMMKVYGQPKGAAMPVAEAVAGAVEPGQCGGGAAAAEGHAAAASAAAPVAVAVAGDGGGGDSSSSSSSDDDDDEG
jgi:hypothetical protein